MHVPARAPRPLDLRPQTGDQAIEPLDEEERLATSPHVEAVLAHGAQVFLPCGGDRPPQADNAWLHPFPSLQAGANRSPDVPARAQGKPVHAALTPPCRI